MKKNRKFISILCIIALTVTAVMSTATLSFGATSKSKYWIKVNAQANVATVYKKVDKKWKPYRAMLCSCGTGKKGSGEDTPTGTYYVQSRWKWLQMVGGVYGRYVVQFYGDFLFHSVPYEYYGDLDSMPAKEFNKLGRDASHGCVRLSIMDSKWVYDNIPRGTKVTVYNSKNPGPLGKPKGIKLPKKPRLTWDPTDPSKKNKKYQLPKPVIAVSPAKKLIVQYGSNYTLKKGITAIDPNTFQNLTSLVTVHQVKRYSVSKKKYIKAKFSTKTLAAYKITYRVKYKYGGTSFQTVKIKVVDNLKKPTLIGAKDRIVTLGELNAVKSLTAKQPSCSRTDAIKVSIIRPDGIEEPSMTYAEASAYAFQQTGPYTVKYTVANKYNLSLMQTKSITITCE